MTHSIRLLVIRRCETTLSWDQLRSPQISAFLVKPIQEQIRNSETLLNRATLYVLIANTLQFLKEGQTNPGNVGVLKTRALVCELLAMRLLKEYSTRELIDALSYDFHPLQGMATGMITPVPGAPTPAKSNLRAVRISTLEIAIRAESKRFLAHPLVVQQLEAIWAGNIVFHSAADNYHRRPNSPPLFFKSTYGTLDTHGRSKLSSIDPSLRRSVTLYDPRDASLFKLSRLRVPRYRQIFSTLSYAIMLGLFLAVLVEKNLDITVLEVLFWFWSAGYMLDEIVGFTEQGFGLYMTSVWNALDVGILLFFVIYYALRICSIILDDEKDVIARMAYDVLAATAVLLFPRLFSVLDHIRYFSQILIAFRMMTRDLLAILCLIIVACSGFFVIFAVSFGGSKEFTPASAAYALFQILMGFTPAAWDVWDSYNILGKAMLGCFLVLAHFIIVTILVTVMTNSFMAIVQNAEHEHLYLFAVNTISMVKSEALFSYIPPSNIIGWLLTPLRYIMPFKKFIRMNRILIKVTHFPILLPILVYERLILARSEYAPAERVERGRPHARSGPAFGMRAPNMFSPGARLREPSVTTFHKDRALEEVFRKPFRGPEQAEVPEEGTIAARRKSTVVQDWMQRMDNASPPMEQPQSVVDRLELRHARLGQRGPLQPFMRKQSGMSRSVASDPEDLRSASIQISTARKERLELPMEDGPQATDADGDDEAGDDEGDDIETEAGFGTQKENRPTGAPGMDYFSIAPNPTQPDAGPSNATRNPRKNHRRQISTATILYAPDKTANAPKPDSEKSSGSASPTRPRPRTAIRNDPGRPKTPLARTPKRTSAFVIPQQYVLPTTQQSPTPPNEPVPPPRQPSNDTEADRNPSQSNSSRAQPIAVPARLGGNRAQNARGQGRGISRDWNRAPSISALDLASDLGDNNYRPDIGLIGGMPASFGTAQMALAGFSAAGNGRGGRGRRNDGTNAGINGLWRRSNVPVRSFGNAFDDARAGTEDHPDDDGSRGGEAGMVSRIMLARMNTLEEGFRELLNEVRDMRRPNGGTSTGGSGRATASGPTARSLEDEPTGAALMASPRKTKKRERKLTGRRVLKGERLKDDDKAREGEESATAVAPPAPVELKKVDEDGQVWLGDAGSERKAEDGDEAPEGP
jgi:hypothetical protein